MPAETRLQRPVWPLPAGVHAFVSTRNGGSSAAPFASFNLGLHVGDDPAAVMQNRALLLAELQARTGISDLRLQWLQQVHGTAVYVAPAHPLPEVPVADAVYCTQPGLACAVLTADCLPVLFAADDGRAVAVAHAGWRGLLDGVLEATLGHFSAPAQVSAWLGPAIGPCHFEVGAEVRTAFLAAALPGEAATTEAAFAPGLESGKWWGDLAALARLRLARAGLLRVHGAASRCTCCAPHLWYSYRSAGRTGRFASVILFTPLPQEAL